MAINSVKFRIEGDGTSAQRALNDLNRGVQGLKNSIGNELNAKIKGVFSAAVIAEMTRRTAEWATNISQTAQKLQVTTNELQGFQVAAGKLAMEKSKVEGFFTTMEDAARDALKGNMDLIKSFGQMKISMNDLRTLAPAKLFEKVLAGTQTPLGLLGAQDIFGRAETQDLKMLSNVMGGKTGEQFAAANPGQIVSPEDISEIRASWTSLLQNLNELKNRFVPLVSLITQVVDGLIQMVSGTLGMITRGWKMIGFSIGSFFGSKDAQAKLEKLSGESQGAATAIGAGIRNSLKGMVNFGAHIFGAKDVFNMEKKPEGMNEQLWREAQGTGAMVTAIATGGVKGFTGKGGAGLSGVAAREAVGGLGDTLTGAKILLNRGKFRIGSMADVEALWKEAGLGEFKAPTNAAEANAIMQKITGKLMGKDKFKGIESALTQGLATTLGIGSGASLAGGVGQQSAADAMKDVLAGNVPFQGRNPLMNLGSFGAGGGPGGGNLHIGGVFGQDVSFRILSLNQEMVTIMSQILDVLKDNRQPMNYVTPTGLH